MGRTACTLTFGGPLLLDGRIGDLVDRKRALVAALLANVPSPRRRGGVLASEVRAAA